MNRACFTKNASLHEKNQHAGCIRPIKNNFVRMKTTYIILLVLISTITLSAINCNISTSSSGQDDGTTKKETRTVEKFDGIGLDISADIKLTQGSPQSIVIEGRGKDLERIVTKMDGTSLTITTTPGWHNMNKVTIYITMEAVKDLHISGSGSITTEGPINTNDLSLHVSGSGSVTIADLKAVNINSHISGSGDINANGLATQVVEIHVSGSGNCKVNASDKLVARVSGSGNVYYSGKPVVDANVSGSGRVKEM